MYRVKLTTHELEKLLLTEKKHKTRDIKRRLRTIRLKHEDVSSKEICKRLEVSQHAVTQWVKLYLSWWLEALCETRYHMRRSSSLDWQVLMVKKYMTANPSSSSSDLQRLLYKNTWKQYDKSWIRKRAKRNGILLQKKLPEQSNKEFF